jgi:hypothetical protein
MQSTARCVVYNNVTRSTHCVGKVSDGKGGVKNMRHPTARGLVFLTSKDILCLLFKVIAN